MLGAAARSGEPLPSRSAATRLNVEPPSGKVTTFWKVPLPLPSRMLKLSPAIGIAAMSGLPSPLRSATARGPGLTPNDKFCAL